MDKSLLCVILFIHLSLNLFPMDSQHKLNERLLKLFQKMQPIQ